MRTLALLLLFSSLASAQTGTVDRDIDPAKEVILVANDAVPESVEIAKHYCALRHVPEANILHITCSVGETIDWAEFREKVLAPFTSWLDRFPDAVYVVPTYGVPLRISAEKSDTPDKYGLGNSACLDAELALALDPSHETQGWVANPLGGKEKHITRADKILMVSRLDGPTPAIARALVDKAIYGETYGPSGKAYLDTRGMKEDGGSYGSTDEEMRLCRGIWDKYGVTHVDEDTDKLVDVADCADAMMYWGWYTGAYNGTKPFTFNPGAIGAHLHSFSATTVRNDTQQWVGPLLAHGITCTMGTVFEPFTVGFPAMYVIYDRMLAGYTWGEAGLLATRINSWMCVFVGDPLYAPWSLGMKATQEKNRALATKGFDNVAAALDANNLDAAVAALAEIAALPVPYEGAKDLSFLERELAARKLAPGKGTIAELQKALSEAAFDKALAISPMNFEANIGAGRAHAAAKRDPQAIACFDNALKIVPESPLVFEPYARTLLSQGKFKEAIPMLKKALAAGAGADCLELMGDACLKAGDVAQAITYLTDALRKDATNRTAAMLLAKAHESNRDAVATLKALQLAVGIPPKSIDDIPAYKAAWKALASAADRAKDKAEKERAGLAVADFESPLFTLPSKGIAIKIGETVESLWSRGTPVALKAPAQEGLKGSLLPRISVGNAMNEAVTIRFKGPLAREIALAPFAGAADPPSKEFGLYPGEYDVVIEAVKGKERRTATGHFKLDVGARYGFVVDGEFKLALPKPKK